MCSVQARQDYKGEDIYGVPPSNSQRECGEYPRTNLEVLLQAYSTLHRIIWCENVRIRMELCLSSLWDEKKGRISNYLIVCV